MFETITTLILSSVLMIYLGLASVGHRFILHRFYLDKLIELFEYGQKDIEKINRRGLRKKSSSNNLMSSSDDSSSSSSSSSPSSSNVSISDKNLNQTFDSDYDTDSAIESEDFDSDREEHHDANKSLDNLDKTKHWLCLDSAINFIPMGIEAIVDDQVTKRFAAEELPTWNLLTRTNKFHHTRSFRLAIVWVIGFVFRYTLLPIRCLLTMIGVFCLFIIMSSIGPISECRLKRKIYHFSSIMCFRILSRCVSAVITYHDEENRAKPGGICVANHTSPIDVGILHCDNAYAMVGQKHGGFLGLLQKILSQGTSHIWFDRFEAEDRSAVLKRLREHVNDEKKLPILLFPEGTCINNSAVMMFKKGSFEIDTKFYPVAIKYDVRFGDPFWNSSKYGYIRYLLMMMTSWAIVCDVWYLPPMTRDPKETAIEFANRVKRNIACKGNLVDLEWDGQLKRKSVNPELVKEQQYKFSQTLRKFP